MSVGIDKEGVVVEGEIRDPSFGKLSYFTHDFGRRTPGKVLPQDAGGAVGT